MTDLCWTRQSFFTDITISTAHPIPQQPGRSVRCRILAADICHCRTVHPVADQIAELCVDRAAAGIPRLAATTVGVASPRHDGGGGDDRRQGGGQAAAFGFVTKNGPDGRPAAETSYGDGQQGLGGPAAISFTWTSEGIDDNVPGGVFHSDGAVALQTWKISHSMSVAAWATEGLFLHENAESWLRFTFGQGPDSRRCRVQSVRGVNNVAEQWVGEGE